jgi:hypothetical protein
MNPKEQEKVYACYGRNYKTIPCTDCEMSWMCDSWRKRAGVNPVTWRVLNNQIPPFNPRTVA